MPLTIEVSGEGIAYDAVGSREYQLVLLSELGLRVEEEPVPDLCLVVRDVLDAQGVLERVGLFHRLYNLNNKGNTYKE